MVALLVSAGACVTASPDVDPGHLLSRSLLTSFVAGHVYVRGQRAI